jgi:MoxR-like ATPase
MITYDFHDAVSNLTSEMDKVIIGYGEIKRFSIAGLFSDQHILLEGVPGTAKSLFAEVFQGAIGESKAVRIQMTADVKPMDLVGVKVYNPGTGKFDFEMGPLFGVNFPLLDELNRAQGKTLSAALSAMQERRIFIAGKAFDLPDPYFCMATENPVEQEGVYPLPEAAVDRFGAKLIVPYATAEEEQQILNTKALDRRDPQSVITKVKGVDAATIVTMREAIKSDVFVSPPAVQYIVALVRATRPGLAEHQAVCAKSTELSAMVSASSAAKVVKRGWIKRLFGIGSDAKVDERIAMLAADGFASSIEVGGSVRGQMALRGFARVFAAMEGRSYVMPEDIQKALLPALRHRTAMTFEATSEGYTSDQALTIIQEHVPFHKEEKDWRPGAK